MFKIYSTSAVFLVVLLLISKSESAAFCSDEYDPVCCLHGKVYSATKWNACLCAQYSGEMMYKGECEEDSEAAPEPTMDSELSLGEAIEPKFANIELQSVPSPETSV